jgi:unsaturated rhamnogalacturonyl hydrolase
MNSPAQPTAWAVRMADSAMARQPVAGPRWAYEWGLMLGAILAVGRATGQPRYFDYVKANVDPFVTPDGQIETYRLADYNLDHINPGKLLFPLYADTGDPRYAAAIALLRDQLRSHPRNSEGGFWHKRIYPNQMWLDGIYMAGPFLAEYAITFDEPALFDDIVRQIQLAAERARDPRTGMLVHAWDASRQQAWADPETGRSPYIWGRAVGWYLMALVDILDWLPTAHPGRAVVVDILARTAQAVVAAQDAESGLWYQIMDRGDREGNYLEASASCMFVYALAKGARQGLLPAAQVDVARCGFEGILRRFVTEDEQGHLDLNGICSVAGLGGNPYRDGSFAYYISEPVVANDYKGVGPFILAGLELDRLG